MSKNSHQSASQQQAIGGIVGFGGVCLGLFAAVTGAGGGVALLIIGGSIALGWHLTFKDPNR